MPVPSRRHLLLATVAAIAGIAASALPAAAQTQPPPLPSALVLEAGLVGQWSGVLVYRDYQNDRRFELPVFTRIQAVADGLTFIRVSDFDDGPKTGRVFITTVSLFDADGRRASQASFRKGRAVETWVEQAEVLAWQDAEHWTVRWQHEGQDNGRPAVLRTTQKRTGPLLEATREVKPSGAPDSEFRQRNQSRLTRQP